MDVGGGPGDLWNGGRRSSFDTSRRVEIRRKRCFAFATSPPQFRRARDFTIEFFEKTAFCLDFLFLGFAGLGASGTVGVLEISRRLRDMRQLAGLSGTLNSSISAKTH